jgi:carbamoyltransferase
VVLNTSFNNNAEPIVDSVDEAVACYLTTGLDALVAGASVVERARDDLAAWEAMAAWLPETVAVCAVDACQERGRRSRHAELAVRASHGRRRRISDTAHAFLLQAGPGRSIGAAADAAGIAPAAREGLLAELRELWANRLIAIGPPGRGS